jgi:PAS domain S-box-containing protein
MDLYEQAIRSARDNGFVHKEAIANERAAGFYAQLGFEKVARVYFQDARYAYARWGADAKVRQLDQSYPRLKDELPAVRSTDTIGTPVEQLDLATVINVSQVVSGEIVLKKLIDTLMRTALKQAGAERGLLILPRGSAQRVEAEAAIVGDTMTMRLDDQAVRETMLPESVLHHVARTREIVILGDAAGQSAFAEDPYIRSRQARSILCLPLINQGKLNGVLYLENNLASSVFAPARVAVLKLLASQAAVSLENSRLYRDLADREAEIRRLVDANIIGVIFWDLEGRIIEANDAFLRIVGYDRQDVSDRLRWTDLTPPEWRDLDERLVREIKTVGSLQPFEKEYFRKDGSRVPVLIGAAGFEEGENRGVAFVLDLTERKRAEAALRRSEAYLTEGQRLSHSGSFGWNVSRGDIFWSAESFNIFGYDQAPSANIDMVLQRVHPEDLALVQRVIAQASSSGRDFDFEHRLLMPDGTVKYVHAVGHAVRDQADELEFIGSVMDVTAAKRAGEELHKAQANLAHAARVMTLGELAASIAHEINQPLAAIATSSNACLRWLARTPPDLDAASRAAVRIAQDAHRAGDVIRGLRALAKKSGPQLMPFDIAGAIQEVLALTRSDLHRHGVELHMNLSAQLPPVIGDCVQLQQVLLNLIMNAIQAMATVADRRRELTISVSPAAPERIQVTVEDNGPGLDPAFVQRIFDPFFTTKSGGLGLGLSISRSIIEAHGGQLWATPRAPHGTAFHFTIPVTSDAPLLA